MAFMPGRNDLSLIPPLQLPEAYLGNPGDIRARESAIGGA
jgi:hypothetical protein